MLSGKVWPIGIDENAILAGRILGHSGAQLLARLDINDEGAHRLAAIVKADSVVCAFRSRGGRRIQGK